MPLRIVQIMVPAGDPKGVDTALGGQAVMARWHEDGEGSREVIQLLLRSGDSEAVMDRFAERFKGEEGFRVVLVPVEGVHPAIDFEEGDEDTEGSGDSPGKRSSGGRVSRAELLGEAEESSRVSGVYIALVVASSVVAAVGLLRDDLAVIIGAMVIAPLLGPNVALSLATTLRDLDLARQALWSNLVGMGVALAVAITAGLLVPVDPTIPSIAARTSPGGPDILLALAAGVAGTLAFTSGFPQTVIGVMVAVALLPPLVCFGLLVGAGLPGPAAGAFLLVAANVICVNLAGVATFLSRGVTPSDWWEAKRARKATLLSAGLWLLLLAVLGLILFLARRNALGPWAS